MTAVDRTIEQSYIGNSYFFINALLSVGNPLGLANIKYSFKTAKFFRTFYGIYQSVDVPRR